MILDTSTVIDILRGDEQAADPSKRNSDIAVASITVMELWDGIQTADIPSDEKERVESILDDIHVYSFDSESAKKAGRINASLYRSGTPIDIEDIMIAAVALTNDEAVMTTDISHYEQIDGLTIVSY